MVDQNRGDSSNIGVQLYSLFILIVDIAVFILKFNYEIIQAIIRLFFKPALKDLNGEIVLITGTGHGIGKELAIKYFQQGCKIICVDINEKDNASTAKLINSQKSGSAFTYKCDVSNRDEVFALADRVKKEVGTVGVLVNNAGIMPTHSLLQHTPEEIRKIFDINVLAHFWTIQAFLPHMISRGRGHIVGISSIAGVVGATNVVPYCGSKFAVRGLMEAIQEEISDTMPNVDINCTTVFPYMVDTGLCKKPRMRFPNALGLLKPSDVADAVVLAHRKGLREATVPRYLLYLNHTLRCYPIGCALTFKEFLDSGLESDL